MSTLILQLVSVIVAYYVCLHSLYLLLIAIGVSQLRHYQSGINFGEFQRIANSPLTMPVTIIIPAFNEEKVIVNTVLSALNLRYPEHEVMVVSDGSKDRTVAALVEHFGMHLVDKVGAKRFDTRPITGIYLSLDAPNLILIEKANGQRADAINAAVNLSRYPLLCIIDADCILEEDAMLRMARPFLRSSAVAAAGGIVRPANGLVVKGGRIVNAGIPRRFLPLIQSIEYLRSFQWARMGLASLNSMLCISGAFMVVRKDIFFAVGGVDPTAITDDIEFTVRLHKYVYDRKARRGLEICYVPDAVCYTEVPESLRILGSQRNRWQRGTLQALMRNWRMTLNPRYGLTGLFGMPFFFVFEAGAPLVEGTSYVLIPVLLLLGMTTAKVMILFLVLAAALGTFLSVVAVLIQEGTRMRTAHAGDLMRLLIASFIENFGYHQIHLVWRILGTFDYIRGRTDLGLMERYGSYQK